MKLEIDLDLNKIDYDSINKQIAEKVAQVNIKEMYDIDHKIEAKLDSVVREEVDNCYNGYLERYWSEPSKMGIDMINNKINEEVCKRINDVIDNLFTDKYHDDKLREILIEILPSAMTSVIFSRLEHCMYKSVSDYQQMMMSNIQSMINYKLSR